MSVVMQSYMKMCVTVKYIKTMYTQNNVVVKDNALCSRDCIIQKYIVFDNPQPRNKHQFYNTIH